MPIDINLLREDRGGNPELVRESQRRRFAPVELVDQIIEQDVAWRGLVLASDKARRDRNAVQQEVAKKKKAKEECDDLVKQIQDFDKKIVDLEAQTKATKEDLDRLLPKIGNLVDDSVPVSQDEEADTEIVRTWGTPTKGDNLLHHHDLLWRVGGYEPDRGVGVAGHRAYFLRDAGVLLNQALINYGIAFLRARQYSIIQPPYFMNRDVMAGVAQLEQFDEELYKVTGDDEKYLIATSEQPICGFHKGEWLDEKHLPLRYGGVSTCFRKEAGSHGKDTWGIFRVHQFDKVEQFVLCEGDLEVSKKLQEEMIAAAEEFYQSLGIAYRVINIVSGELNNAAIKKLDLEGYFPGYDNYRELVSCSNCTDYQARAMEIRCGTKKLGQDTKKYVHMLNATLCATGRTICAILENYQTPEGVRVPEVLVPFMGGITFLPFVREARKDASVAKTQDQKKGGGTHIKPKQKAAANGGSDASLDAAIAAKGGEIRELKAAKADKAAIQARVDELLALKKQYKEKTGAEWGAGSAPAAGAAKAPAPAPAPSTAEGPALSAEAEGIKEQIVAKGDEIRQLKASKADKASLEPHIKALTDLKAKFKDVAGFEYVVAGQPAPSKSKEKKQKPAAPPVKPTKAASAPDSNKHKSAPPPEPKSKPAPPAPPQAQVGQPKGPLVDNGRPNLENLNTYLHTRSYIRGFVPTHDDKVVYEMLTGGVDGAKYPHLARWHRHIGSFAPAECDAWPA